MGCSACAVNLGLVATVYSGYTQEFGVSTLNTVLMIPIALQEMVLAVWLLVKGFNPSNVDGESDSIRPSETDRPTGRVRQVPSTGEGVSAR